MSEKSICQACQNPQEFCYPIDPISKQLIFEMFNIQEFIAKAAEFREKLRSSIDPLGERLDAIVIDDVEEEKKPPAVVPKKERKQRVYKHVSHVCDICADRFECFKQFIEHKRTHKMVRQAAESAKKLFKDMANDDEENTAGEKNCEEYKPKGAVAALQQQGTTTTPKPARCHICFNQSPSRKALLEHRRDIHKLGKKGFSPSCGICGIAFTKSIEVSLHNLKFHKELL